MVVIFLDKTNYESEMNLVMTSSPLTTHVTRTQIEQHIDRMNQPVNAQNTTLIVALAVILPTLLFVIVITSVIIVYRRRHSTVWLRKLENSTRLQAIVVDLSPTLIRTQYD